MHGTSSRTVRSINSELQPSLRNEIAWYGTLVRLVRTFHSVPKNRSVPVPSQRARILQVYRTF